MVGRPRRRHVVAKDGRLNDRTKNSPIAGSTARVDDRRLNRLRFKLPKKLRIAVFAVFTIAVLSISYLLAAGAMTYNKIVDRSSGDKGPALSFLGGIKQKQLQGESDGRINILLIGVGGPKHPGGNLADTIIVASLDPKKKEVALLSVPRDLYVDYDNGKREGKINSVHAYGEQDVKKTGGGAALMEQVVGEVLDLPIHYYVRVDFTALEKTVDTLGGITVTVDNAIYDPQYPADNMIDYAPFRLAAGQQTLNGKTALKYVRSRHGGNGEGSDFARAKRQQKTLTAIKEKALSVGVLTNPKKIADLIGILGDHVKTDITAWEAERFFQIAKDVEASKFTSTVLDAGVNGPLISHSGDARGYILLPRSGDYSEIQAIAKDVFIDPFLRQEAAKIAIVNASGSSATGQYVIALLRGRGYQVTDVTPRGQAKQEKTTAIDHTKDSPYTKTFLKDRLGATVTDQSTSQSSTSATATYDMTVTIGSSYAVPTKKSTASPKASPATTSRTNGGTDATSSN